MRKSRGPATSSRSCWPKSAIGNVPTPESRSDGVAGRPQPQFDIEHIIPFSRSLDNSFHNKTLCDVKENRDVKQNRTPYEAYASTRSGGRRSWRG